MGCCEDCIFFGWVFEEEFGLAFGVLSFELLRLVESSLSKLETENEFELNSDDGISRKFTETVANEATPLMAYSKAKKPFHFRSLDLLA